MEVIPPICILTGKGVTVQMVCTTPLSKYCILYMMLENQKLYEKIGLMRNVPIKVSHEFAL
mgnify:CR=1 FL=1